MRRSVADVFAIDPGIMQHNGRLYVMWSGLNQCQHNGINIAPLSNPWTVSGNAVAHEAVFHERWASGADLAAHQQQTFMKQFAELSTPYLDGVMTLRILHSLSDR